MKIILILILGTDTPIINGMVKELERNKTRLQIPGEKKPYFILYRIDDVGKLDVRASEGSLVQSQLLKFRTLHTNVRVGDYDFDSGYKGIFSGHPAESQEEYFYQFMRAPLEPSNKFLRHILWLSTDFHYKRALESYINRMKNKFVRVKEETIPSFVRVNPEVFIGNTTYLRLNSAKLENKIKEISQRFTGFSDISEVGFSGSFRNIYIVSTEGTRIRWGKDIYSLSLSAKTVDKKGKQIVLDRSFYAIEPEELLQKANYYIERFKEDFNSILEGEEVSHYRGPVLLTGQASTAFFHIFAGHELQADPEKFEIDRTFLNLVGKEITPSFLNIQDLPNLKKFREKFLAGYYPFDEEGVKPEGIYLVKEGILKNFLMSRTPISGFISSNGHGRAGVWSAPSARIGNLIVRTEQKKGANDIFQEFLKEIESHSSPYGIVVEEMEGNPGTTVFKLKKFNKVYPDGTPWGKKKTLKKGTLHFLSPLDALRNILSTDTLYYLENTVCTGSSGSIFIGLVAPSILVKYAEVYPTEEISIKPPILSPP